ncbi:hypothetical protein H696_03403 [Fonticula alba]|uniref:Uncharacterized protein n=1 Tax=Fonticula alba TaxID=691883 RepID=A0A058Z7P5_FONAL|nr:hypothetical protein H696_03403 [Fonticula alba]KCV69938.1 hypothetical protein H696_03403 [Fonticula alba]|eukprot:XP_009495544.1 hypothetical protein H696_03403 [Fonticula alba]
MTVALTPTLADLSIPISVLVRRNAAGGGPGGAATSSDGPAQLAFSSRHPGPAFLCGLQPRPLLRWWSSLAPVRLRPMPSGGVLHAVV